MSTDSAPTTHKHRYRVPLSRTREIMETFLARSMDLEQHISHCETCTELTAQAISAGDAKAVSLCITGDSLLAAYQDIRVKARLVSGEALVDPCPLKS